MLVQIPNVLTAGEVTALRARIDAARWVDGNVTSGHQSAQAKSNEQVPEESPVARECGETILQALGRSPLFVSSALPARVFPPLFNRYREGMTFANHVDSALRSHAPSGMRIRTDLSATLFRSDPEQYDGGELVIDDNYGMHSVKLQAGAMAVYPSSSLHRVSPVTRGTRVASFFWIQSLVRDDAQRTLLFDLDMAVIRLTQRDAQAPELVGLTGVYHNLLRMWAEP